MTAVVGYSRRSPLQVLLDAVPPWLLVAVAVVGVGGVTGVAPKWGIAAAIAVCATAVGLVNPRILAYGAVAIVPILPGLRRGIPVAGFRLTELVTVGVMTIVVASAGRQRVTWRGLDWAAFAWVTTTVVLGVVDSTAHGIALTGPTWGDILGPVQFFLLFRLVRTAFQTDEHRSRALGIALWASVPISLIAIGQFANIGGLRATIISLTDSASAPAVGDAGVARATSLFAHYHSLAGYLVLVELLLAALITTRRQSVLPARWLLFIAAIDLAGLATALTFADLLGVVVGLFVIAFRRKVALRFLVCLVPITALTGLALSSSLAARLSQQSAAPVYYVNQPHYPFLPETIAFRVNVWVNQYIPVIEHYLAFGWGPELPDSIAWRSTESLYISQMLRGGVLLTLCYLLLIVVIFRTARAAESSNAPLQAALGLALTTTVVVISFMQFEHPYFTDAGFPHLLWISLGLLAVTSPRTTGRVASTDTAKSIQAPAPRAPSAVSV